MRRNDITHKIKLLPIIFNDQSLLADTFLSNLFYEIVKE